MDMKNLDTEDILEILTNIYDEIIYYGDDELEEKFKEILSEYNYNEQPLLNSLGY
jgi:hypothetical protein